MKKMMILTLVAAVAMGCKANTTEDTAAETEEPQATFRIDSAGRTIAERYVNLDTTFFRKPVEEGSWAAYLLSLELQPVGYPCHLYNGEEKWEDYQCGVLTVDCPPVNLQQCADAAMRLRSEYLYAQGRYDEIGFNFTNGMPCPYRRWAEGGRVHLNGNKSWWQQDSGRDYSYATFRQYLLKVFMYAGSLSLSKELRRIDVRDVQPGDLLIDGGTPGHVETIVDVLYSRDGKRLRLMLAQSYLPAQEIEILRHDAEDGSPWMTIDLTDYDDTRVLPIATPSYPFTTEDIFRWEKR